MGYCMEMTDSNFIIKKENFNKALENLKSIFVPEKMTTHDYINGIKYPHFRWVETECVINSDNIYDALTEIRYKPSFNNNGDVIDVEFIGEKYGDEKIFFSALAPYVEKGSYLDFEGEDECTWSWNFDGENVTLTNT